MFDPRCLRRCFNTIFLVWTTMLRRFKGDTFPSGTDSFKRSYGVMGTFWLGLYNLHELAKSGKTTLLITYVRSGTAEEYSMEYNGFRILENNTFRADYKVFRVIKGNEWIIRGVSYRVLTYFWTVFPFYNPKMRTLTRSGLIQYMLAFLSDEVVKLFFPIFGI